MKRSKTASQEAKAGASPSHLIDAKIKALGDWRGEMLGAGFGLVHAATFPWSKCDIKLQRHGPYAAEPDMKIKAIVHDAEEGGFWAEVPAIPGCATQGDTMDELMRNLHEAIEGCLSVDIAEPKPGGKQRILEIAV